MRRSPNPFLALALLVVLTAGAPVPRVIPVDPDTCRDMCRAETACPPCPAASRELPCRESRGVEGQTCVRCQCAIGVLVPQVDVSPPAADETDYFLPQQLLQPTPAEPASPPPKAAA